MDYTWIGGEERKDGVLKQGVKWSADNIKVIREETVEKDLHKYERREDTQRGEWKKNGSRGREEIWAKEEVEKVQNGQKIGKEWQQRKQKEKEMKNKTSRIEKRKIEIKREKIWTKMDQRTNRKIDLKK